MVLSLVYPLVDNVGLSALALFSSASEFWAISFRPYKTSSCDKRLLPDFPFSCLEVPRAPLHFLTPSRTDPCFEVGSILGESIEMLPAAANLLRDNNG